MDTFDARLFCLLRDCYFEPSSSADRRPSPAGVAKMLKVDVKTVRKRMKNWERSGFVKHYQVLPNYNLLGIKAATFLFTFRDTGSKARSLEKLKLVEGVGSVLDLLGESALVWLAFRDDDELASRLELMAELTDGSKQRRFMDELHPPVELRMTQLDWQILRSMRNDALKPLTAVAHELGVTRKTVRLHISRMADKRAFFVRAMFDVKRVTGLIFYGLALNLDPAVRKETVSQIDSIITCGENCFMRFVTPAGDAFLGLWSKDLAGIEETYLKAKEIAGVKSAEIWLYKEIRDYPKFLDAALGRLAARSDRRVTTPELKVNRQTA